jgi:hypothetical protein
MSPSPSSVTVSGRIAAEAGELLVARCRRDVSQDVGRLRLRDQSRRSRGAKEALSDRLVGRRGHHADVACVGAVALVERRTRIPALIGAPRQSILLFYYRDNAGTIRPLPSCAILEPQQCGGAEREDADISFGITLDDLRFAPAPIPESCGSFWPMFRPLRQFRSRGRDPLLCDRDRRFFGIPSLRNGAISKSVFPLTGDRGFESVSLH